HGRTSQARGQGRLGCSGLLERRLPGFINVVEKLAIAMGCLRKRPRRLCNERAKYQSIDGLRQMTGRAKSVYEFCRLCRKFFFWKRSEDMPGDEGWMRSEERRVGKG